MKHQSVQFGVSILDDTLVSATSSFQEVQAVIIDTFPNTPATEYHNGVDVAIIRFSSTVLNIPDGYYKVTTRAKTEIKHIGVHECNTSIENSDGRTVYTWTHNMNVQSLTVPKDKSDRNAVIQINGLINREPGSPIEPLGFQLLGCCSNGTCGTCICPSPVCPDEWSE